MKPTFRVVIYSVPIQSVADMDKKAVIRKFKLKNYRILSNYKIIKWRWLKPLKENQKDILLVLKFKTALGINTIIYAKVLYWDSIYKRIKRFNHTC